MTRKARHTSSHSEKDYYKRNAFYINTPNLKCDTYEKDAFVVTYKKWGQKKDSNEERSFYILDYGKNYSLNFVLRKNAALKKTRKPPFFMGNLLFSIELEKPRFSSELDFFSLAQICCE